MYPTYTRCRSAKNECFYSIQSSMGRPKGTQRVQARSTRAQTRHSTPEHQTSQVLSKPCMQVRNAPNRIESPLRSHQDNADGAFDNSSITVPPYILDFADFNRYGIHKYLEYLVSLADVLQKSVASADSPQDYPLIPNNQPPYIVLGQLTSCCYIPSP